MAQEDHDIYARFHKALCDGLRHLDALKEIEGLDLSAVMLHPPREAAHGDMATNAALVLAKPSGIKPRDLADMIKPALENIAGVQKIEIAGPGFINLYLHDDVWQKELAHILAAGENYGKSAIGAGEKVNIEYVSANPTGPMHIGHARGAVFGDALARLMAYAGYDVTREYYVNDEGAQIDALAQSVFLRVLEAMGERIDVSEVSYPGEYLIELGKQIAADNGSALKEMDEVDRHHFLRKASVEAMMEVIKKDLKSLGIEHDVFTYESELHQSGAVAMAVDFFEKKGSYF